MLVAIVYCHVKPEHIDAFKAASMENARNSIQEEGCAQFDVIQQQDDPTRFVLYEAYYSEEAPVKHRETAHYLTWRDTVADMMAEPRTAVRYNSQFPADSEW